METELAYFAFVSFGIFPEDLERRSMNEKILMHAMMSRFHEETKTK